MVDQVKAPTYQYFATLPPDQLAGVCMAKANSYWEFLSACGRLGLLRLAYYQYYSAETDNGVLLRAGLNGEYVCLPLNHYKNLVDHLHSLITSQKFSYTPRPINSDYKSMAASVVSRGLLEYYDNDPEKRVSQERKIATKYALQFAEGWITLDWDATLGEEVGVNPDGSVRKQGDFVVKSFLPTDIIRDTSSRKLRQPWYITREYVNKWDLAAKYPELAKEITAIKASEDDLSNLRLITQPDMAQSDLIPLFTLRHGKTAALPNGRFFKFLDGDTWLADGDLPYRSIHVYPVVDEEQAESCFAYTRTFHLLPLQQQLNNLASVVATNHTLGVTNVLIPEGANVTVEQLAEGLVGFKYNPMNGMKPEALNLVNTPKEIFSMMEMLIQSMETLAGISSVNRGEVPTNLRSGSALALVAAQAIQFSSGLQESYANLVADVASGIIQLLQDFPDSARVALIAGRVNQPLLQEFKADDLAPITRVQIELANPLASTTAGRVQLAETLVQNGLVKDPQKYIMVLQTGTLEPEIEGAQAEMLYIKQENETLAKGQPCQAIKTDNHGLHISEHKAVLCNLQARQDPAVLQVTLNHITEHIQLAMQLQVMEPALAQILGYAPLAMPMAPTGAPGMADPTSPTEKKADEAQPSALPTLPPGTPESTQAAYEQQGGPATNPTNNARANK